MLERRRALRDTELELLERIAREGDEDAARRLVALDPLRESGVGLLMEALAAGGDVAQALQVYENLRERLRDELGTVPAAHLRELAEHLLIHQRAPAVQAPRLVGRDADLAALRELLSRARLVTLTGPGGVGKTSLALALSEAVMVELAPVADAAFVAAAIADALSIAFEEGETAREALLRGLAGRRALLVLDNFEQVLDAAPLVAELLDACPGLTIVCTSRAPLQLSAEQRYPVEPLQDDAIELFAERARARDPHFDPSAHADAIRTICTRVGGLPLAVELAAARIGFLSADELAADLDLDLLVGGARDRPDRQRTLRATLDWSHNLLTCEEQEAFAAFAVFAGGATLPAARSVTQASLATLESLATNSLLTRSGGRLSMLEPVRAYAAERLTDIVRERHARWLIELGEETFGDLAHVTQPEALAAFRPEADNLRAALAYAPLALELVTACGQFWSSTNQLPEGRAYLDATLTADAPAPLRMRGLALRAKLWGRSEGAIEGRVADLEAALALASEPRDVTYLQMRLSRAEFDRRRLDAAVALAEQAMASARGLGDRSLIGRALAIRVLAEPLRPDAPQRAREAIRPLLRDGDVADAVNALIDVGYLALADRRYAEARELLEEADALAGSQMTRFFTRANVGLVYLLLGEADAAARALRESLAIALETGIDGIDEVLLALAAHAVLGGDLERAARLAGAGHAHEPATLRHYELRVNELLDAEYLAPGRERLGAARWDELAAEGARLGSEEAIALGR